MLFRSRKAQFFVMAAFAIVTFAFYIGSWMEPGTIPDIAEVMVSDEAFVFDNLVEKVEEVVRSAGSYDELKYGLDEFSRFARKFVLERGYDLELIYELVPPPPEPQPPIAVAMVCIRLRSPRMTLEATRILKWPS
jgi:hypothetical protein